MRTPSVPACPHTGGAAGSSHIHGLQQSHNVRKMLFISLSTSDRTNIVKRVEWVLALKCKPPSSTEPEQQHWVCSNQASKAPFDHTNTPLSCSCTTLNQLLCMKEFSLYLQKQRPKISWVPALILVLSKPQSILISKSLWLLFRKCSWWCPIDSVLC